jgi:hypothetical protein
MFDDEGGCGCGGGRAKPLREARPRKVRKGPTASATAYDVGTKRKGGDGRTWVVKETKTGVKRWGHLARKGPTASATGYDIGTKRKGGDGNQWVVKATATGVKRWSRVPAKAKKAASK